MLLEVILMDVFRQNFNFIAKWYLEEYGLENSQNCLLFILNTVI